jgi:hypothetical protein
MSKNLKLKVNFDVFNHKSGDIINVKCDEKGEVIDKFWRDRLKDSEKDNCVEIVKGAQSNAKSKDTQETQETEEEKNDDSGNNKKPSKKGKG